MKGEDQNKAQKKAIAVGRIPESFAWAIDIFLFLWIGVLRGSDGPFQLVEWVAGFFVHHRVAVDPVFGVAELCGVCARVGEALHSIV